MQELINALPPDTPLAIIVLDASGVIKDINHWMASWAGLDKEGVKGKPVEQIFPEVASQPWPFSRTTSANTGSRLATVPDTFRLGITTGKGVLEGVVSEFGKNRTLSERLATRDAIVKHFVIYGILLKLA